MGTLKFKIDDIAQIAEMRRRKNFDCIICFTGARGDGKSSSGYVLGKKASLYTRGNKFMPKKDLVYTREELLKALSDWDRIIDADEMINSAYKREFYNVDQIELVKILNMYRDHRHILIICIPNFWDLDKPLRDLVKIRIDVIRRGFGVVHVGKRNLYSNDPWDSKINQKIEAGFHNSGGTYKPKFHRLTTFMGYIKLPKMSERSYSFYQKLKNNARIKIEMKKAGTEIEQEQNKRKREKHETTNNWVKHLVVDIKEGKYNYEKLELEIKAQGFSIQNIKNKLNSVLILEGSGKSLRDYMTKKGRTRMEKQTIQEAKREITLPLLNEV